MNNQENASITFEDAVRVITSDYLTADEFKERMTNLFMHYSVLVVTAEKHNENHAAHDDVAENLYLLQTLSGR